MKRWQHYFDFYFGVVSISEDPCAITGEDLREAALKRIASLEDEELLEAFGHHHTEEFVEPVMSDVDALLALLPKTGDTYIYNMGGITEVRGVAYGVVLTYAGEYPLKEFLEKWTKVPDNP